MKTAPTISCLGLAALCSLPLLLADEPRPEIHGPAIERPQEAPIHPAIQVQVPDLDELQGPEVIQLVPAKPKPQTEAIPEIYAKEPAARLVLEDLKRDESGLSLHAVLRIINPTDQPLVFTGFSEKSPVTQQQQWEDGKWIAVKQFLRCGTGLRPCTIAPGQSAVFSISAPPERLPMRVGISTTDGSKKAEQQMLWSDKIEQ